MSGKFTVPNHRNKQDAGDPNFYPTPYAALPPLLRAEKRRIPHRLVEPACGNGALVLPLRNRGYDVVATDLHDWSCPDAETGVDFLSTAFDDVVAGINEPYGIITNPPFNIIGPFVERAVSLSPYVAFFARLAFLESEQRMNWFRRVGLRRVLVISERLPMIHRHGYEGKKQAASGMAFGWFIFEAGKPPAAVSLKWLSWKQAARRDPERDEDVPPTAEIRLPLLDRVR